MIDLSLFDNTLFTINIVTGIISFIAYTGVVILLPFYLENILGYSVRKAGLLMTVVPIMLGLLSPVSGALSDRLGARPVTIVGLCLLLFAYLFASTLSAQTTTMGYITRLVFLGAGMGFFMSPNNSAVMGTASKERLGITSGMLTVSRTLGQTFGACLLGTFWACRTLYHTTRLNGQGGHAADSAAQVLALHDAFYLVSFMIFCALLLSLSGILIETRMPVTKATCMDKTFPRRGSYANPLPSGTLRGSPSRKRYPAGRGIPFFICNIL